MAVKAAKFPNGAIVELPNDHEEFPTVQLMKGPDYNGGDVWEASPGKRTHHEWSACFTNEELDEIDFKVVEIPHGYDIGDFDQEAVFAKKIRNMSDEKFQKLMTFLETL